MSRSIFSLLALILLAAFIAILPMRFTYAHNRPHNRPMTVYRNYPQPGGGPYVYPQWGQNWGNGPQSGWAWGYNDMYNGWQWGLNDQYNAWQWGLNDRSNGFQPGIGDDGFQPGFGGGDLGYGWRR